MFTKDDKNDSEQNQANNILNILETVDDDFAEEINKKKTEELKKKQQYEHEPEQKEDDIVLGLLEADESLQDIASLNNNNIDEFLKKFGKQIIEHKEKKKEINIDSLDLTIPLECFADFKLHKDIWSDLNLSDSDMNTIELNVKFEIKDFLQKKLASLLISLLK